MTLDEAVTFIRNNAEQDAKDKLMELYNQVNINRDIFDYALLYILDTPLKSFRSGVLFGIQIGKKLKEAELQPMIEACLSVGDFTNEK